MKRGDSEMMLLIKVVPFALMVVSCGWQLAVCLFRQELARESEIFSLSAVQFQANFWKLAKGRREES
jgi:hypothetical protein